MNNLTLYVFLMDYHSGQWSRGYRILSRMHVGHVTAAECSRIRETGHYQMLVNRYAEAV